MTPHKNEEGIYNINFYDKHGRHLKEQDKLGINLLLSKELGDIGLTVPDTNAVSYVIKRVIYNSIDHN